MMTANIIALSALLVWIYLVQARGGFWLAKDREPEAAAPSAWVSVAVVIPARNEAEGIGEAIQSLLRQDYPGAL